MPTEDEKRQIYTWVRKLGLGGITVRGADGSKTHEEHIEDWIGSGDDNPSTETPKMQIIRYNFAGSSEETPLDSPVGSSAMDKPSPKGTKSKEATVMDGSEDVLYNVQVDYTGPMGWLGSKGGRDAGYNSTDKVVASAMDDFDFKLDNLVKLGMVSKDPKVVRVEIIGFSRGAAAANKFANYVAASNYVDYIETVKLVSYDPVHGSGSNTRLGRQIDLAKQPRAVELSPLVDSFRILPIKSKQSWGIRAFFEPQHVSGAKSACIVYGNDAKHSSGQRSEFYWQNGSDQVVLSGPAWNDVTPKGLWKADSSGASAENPNEIDEVSSLLDLEILFSDCWAVKSFGGGWFTDKRYKLNIEDAIRVEYRDLEILRVCAGIMNDPKATAYINEYVEWHNRLRTAWKRRRGTITEAPLPDVTRDRSNAFGNLEDFLDRFDEDGELCALLEKLWGDGSSLSNFGDP